MLTKEMTGIVLLLESVLGLVSQTTRGVTSEEGSRSSVGSELKDNDRYDHFRVGNSSKITTHSTLELDKPTLRRAR